MVELKAYMFNEEYMIKLILNTYRMFVANVADFQCVVSAPRTMAVSENVEDFQNVADFHDVVMIVTRRDRICS